MSTYTDLHQRMKDNITVLRHPGCPDDGVTPQLVKMLNPENEFYGTFNGKANVTGGTFKNVDVTGAYIHNAELSNVYLNGLKVDNLVGYVQYISGEVSGTQTVLNDAITANADCHKKLLNYTISNDAYLSNQISILIEKYGNIPQDLTQTLDNISTSLSDSIISHSDELYRTISGVSSILSNDLHETRWHLTGKINKVSAELSNQIKALSDGISADVQNLSTGLSNAIDRLSTNLSNDVDSLSTRLSNDVDRLTKELSDSIVFVSTGLSLEVQSLSTRLSNDIDSLSTRLSNDIDSLSTRLSNDIDSLSTRLSNDIDTLEESACISANQIIAQHEADVAYLKRVIDNDRFDSINGDKKLNAKIIEGLNTEKAERVAGDETTLDLAKAFTKIDKHYSFKVHSPYAFGYEMEEYAINSIKTDAPLAFLVDENENPIGKLIALDTENTTDDTCEDSCTKFDGHVNGFTIQFFNSLSDDYRYLIEQDKYTYKFDQETHSYDLGNFTLSWESYDKCSSVDDIMLVFRTADNFATWDITNTAGTKVGYASNLIRNSYTNAIVSCNVKFNDSLKTIALEQQDTVVGNTRYSLSGNDLSVFRQYEKRYSQVLSAQEYGFDNEFGYILASGVSKDEDGNISALTAFIYRADADPAEVHLVSVDTPETRVDINWTNYIVGFDAVEKVVRMYDKRRIYVYKTSTFDESYVPGAILSVGSIDENDQEFNKTIFDDFNHLSVTLNGFKDVPSVIKLTKNGNLFEYKDDDLDLYVKYATPYLHVERAGNRIDYLVNTADEQIYKTLNFDKVIYTSQAITDEFNHIDYIYDSVDLFNISTKQNPYDIEHSFAFDYFEKGEAALDVYMPDAIDEKSREFILTLSLNSSQIKAVKLNLIGTSRASTGTYKFEYLGETVKGIYFLTDRTTTIKFQEIAKNKFVIQDVDDSFLAGVVRRIKHQIDDLSEHHEEDFAELANQMLILSSNLSAEISQLSTNLSNDIDKLSVETFATIGQLSSNLCSEIDSLSNETFATIGKLSTETHSLSDSISAEVSAIQKHNAEQDVKIEDVTNRFTELCTTTFAKIDAEAEPNEISSFNLVITDTRHPTDDKDHTRYYMTFESGTLVLKPLE